jgi:membrane protein implicated in regulation of membrane protease activity
MYLIAIAWGFVVVLMALVEATSTEGTVLGAFFTLLLYGVLPLSIVMYVLGTPMRRQARAKREALEQADRSDHAPARPAEPLTPEREEP